MENPLWRLTASELANAIATGEVRADEVVRAHLERIATVNPKVNAITNVLEESAIETAREVDRKRLAGHELGPLAGVPFTVKENIDVAGSPTTQGVPALRQAMPSADAPIVERLRRAGAIPIGRTNLPDFSIRFHTSSQLYGDTINPWDPELSPGGSSGGEGVALATGMSALGIGNDAGGSVRIPALFAGVAALKPSYGRFPADRTVGPRDLTLSSQWIPVEGVLSRSVADLRRALEVLSGPDARDPRTVPAPLAGPPSNFRVAVVPDPGGQGVHPNTRSAIEAAAGFLKDAGYSIEIVDVPRLEESLDAYGKLVLTEFGLVWPNLRKLLSADGRRYIEFGMAQQPPIDLAEYVRLTAVRQGIQRDWAQFLEQYSVLLGPVFTGPPVEPGFDARGAEEHALVARAMRLCTASSFVGVPAVAVPTSLVDGLPQGVQVIAGFYREDVCLDAAAVIESRCGFLTPIDPCN
jgi:amidase